MDIKKVTEMYLKNSFYISSYHPKEVEMEDLLFIQETLKFDEYCPEGPCPCCGYYSIEGPVYCGHFDDYTVGRAYEDFLPACANCHPWQRSREKCLKCLGDWQERIKLAREEIFRRDRQEGWYVEENGYRHHDPYF